MDTAIQQRVTAWLEGHYDQATKSGHYKPVTLMSWLIRFTGTWNSVQADCGASWVWAPTG